MIPLTASGNGDTGTIMKITGKDDVRQRLAEMGFVMGARVAVLSEISGNMILEVKHSRVALDRTMAARILVDPD